MNNFKIVKDSVYESYSLNEAESDRKVGRFFGNVKNNIQQKWNDFKDGYKSTQQSNSQPVDQSRNNSQQTNNQQQNIKRQSKNNQQKNSPIKSKSQFANDVNSYITASRNFFNILTNYQTQLQSQLDPNAIDINTNQNSQLFQRATKYANEARSITDRLLKQLKIIRQRFAPCSQKLRQFGTADETVNRDLPRFNLAIGKGQALLSKLVGNNGLITLIHSDLTEYANILLPDGRPKSFTSDDFNQYSHTLNDLAHRIQQNINVARDYLVSIDQWGQFFDLLSNNKEYDSLMNSDDLMAAIISAMADWNPNDVEDILNINDAFDGALARGRTFRNASDSDINRNVETKGVQGFLNLMNNSQDIKTAVEAGKNLLNLVGSDSMINFNRGNSRQSQATQERNNQNRANVNSNINQRDQQLHANNIENSRNDGKNTEPRFSESFRNIKSRILEAASGRVNSDLGDRIYNILGNDKNFIEFVKAVGSFNLTNPDDPYVNFILQNKYLWANGFCNSGNSELDFNLFKLIYNWRVKSPETFNNLGNFFQNSRVFTNGYNQRILQKIVKLDDRDFAALIKAEQNAYKANHTLDDFNIESFLQQHASDINNYNDNSNNMQRTSNLQGRLRMPASWSNRNDDNEQIFNSIINLIQNGNQVSNKRDRRVLQELNATLEKFGYNNQ